MHLPLGAWTWHTTPRPTPAEDGLINQTWLLHGDAGPLAVLQRLNTSVFRPEVHEDIEAVTRHLVHHGLPTPLLLRTTAGGLWHTDADGGVWRCLTHVGDRTIHRVEQLSDARSAAALLARFHRALGDLEWTFRSIRQAVHDTRRHMGLLVEALDSHHAHRLFDRVAPLADEVLAAWEATEVPGPLPRRIIHGDPKISNIRFQGPEALALIDLDTLAHGVLPVELGDAMRSWCNRSTEDATEAVFDLAVFRAAMEGYGTEGVRAEEWAAVVRTTERICWELASRFARDALEECYFGWDVRHGTHGEHNLVRAAGQAALARAVRRSRTEADGIVEALWRASHASTP